MVVEFLGGKLAGFAFSKISEPLWKRLGETVRKQVKPNDFDRALKSGVETAEKWDGDRPLQSHLFYHCDGGKAKACFSKFLENSVTAEELTKPLQNNGQPNLDLLEEVLRNSAEDIKIKLVNETVRGWLEQFSQGYFESTQAALHFQVYKTKYIQQFICHFDDVKFAGMEIEKSARLEKIFVMPDVREEVSNRPDATDLDFLKVSEIENRQFSLLQEQRQLARRDRSGKTFSAKHIFQPSKATRVVVLGDPGSGKTTLLSYFGVAVSEETIDDREAGGLDNKTDWLPILIRIRDWARNLENSPIDYAKKFTEKTLHAGEVPTGFFEYWLETGRALILLDGLDEVANEAKRYEVVQRIENFLEKYHKNPAIVTSRPAGYKRDFLRTETFPHYWLQPFNDEQLEEFINKWYDSRVSDSDDRERRKESLREALNENDRIKSLARNPLLLTIIALIHRHEAHLPKQRHKLYDLAVKTLLKSWDSNKSLKQEGFKYLDSDDWRRLMEVIAHWVHTQGNTGDDDGGTLIDRDTLIEKLAREIKQMKQIELYQAQQEAERFLSYIRERTGLLNEQGQDCFAFVHKTFQEYLTAEDINYRADNEEKFDIVLNAIRNHLHDSHWREVLLLLIAQQKQKKAAKAIEAVLDCNSEYEEWLHRDLLFAGSCLVEDPKDLQSENPKLCQDILERIVELEVSDRVGGNVSHAVYKILRSLNETAFEQLALTLLKDKGDAIGEDRLLRYRARLGERDAVMSALVECLKDEDSRVRSKATSALVRLGEASETAISALVECLKDEDSRVRSEVAWALGELGEASETAISALVECLKDEDSEVRFQATLALGELGGASQTAISALVECLKDEDSGVRSEVAWALGELGGASETAISALVERLKDEDSEVRSEVAWALGELGGASETAISALVERLKDEDSEVRSSAAWALGELGEASETAISALVERLKDEDSRVRSLAAWALGRLGGASETGVLALVERLKDEASEVRSSAAWALGRLGGASETGVLALVERLKDEASEVRSSAASALGELGEASETAISALVERLKDEASEVRSSAAWALGELRGASETAISMLVERLKDEDSPWVRSLAASALGKLGQNSDNVLPRVVEWLDRHREDPHVGAGIDALWGLVVESS
ncbi:sister chromatid cohesion protein PDS5 [Baaleninema simplex]|uniref:sister chromatid cohesion protein PDS5 n=1 Tax=Baaleninema simplex TaxID=2862350 RepID=UPI00037A66EC|nr:sister chromatid cohesion protein PDS5 [Baaleninema simplex]